MEAPAAPQDLVVRVVLNPQDDGSWAAIAPDYAIVGVGDSHEAALHEMDQMLGDYLRRCISEGMTVRDARRPISLRWRTELRARWLLGRLTRLLHRRRPFPESRDIHLESAAFC